MTDKEKLQAIYELCLSVKEGETFLEDSVIDEIIEVANGI